MNPREIREEAARLDALEVKLDRVKRAAADIQSDPEIADAVTDGLTADLAKHGPRITATRIERRVVCEIAPPRGMRVFEIHVNEEDGGILEARDAIGRVWASGMTEEALCQALYGMTLPE